jgi:hypothetical protein
MDAKPKPHFKREETKAKGNNSLKIFLWLVGIITVIIIFAVASDSTPTTPTTTLSKEHAIEVTLETKHLTNDMDVITTTENIYLKGKLIKESVHYDTIPSLSDTTMIAEDDDGNSQRISRKNDYQFFVTVK